MLVCRNVDWFGFLDCCWTYYLEGEVMEFLKTYSLPYQDLQACLIFTAKQDIRFDLCGIYVGQGIIAGTHGHAALICEAPEVEDADLIIPREAIISLIRKLGKSKSIKSVALHKIDDDFWLLQHADVLEIFRPISGKFPDIKRVDIPKPERYTAEEFPTFNFDYLLDIRKAASIYMGFVAPKIYPTTSNGTAYIEINDRVHGLLMPART